MALNRTPPEAVLRELRAEVGFGCPVSSCRNPYLAWHHFDPPWHVRPHHEPSGMIALCLEHHAQADAGAFTVEQLRELKLGTHDPSDLAGEFAWRRRELLAVVGGGFYYETPVVFEFRNHPVIWFTKDEGGRWLLNVSMLSTVAEPRVVIRDNFWLQLGKPAELRCPPSGKLLHVRYGNGDKLVIAFRESTQQALQRRYGMHVPDDLPYPITTVEVSTTVAGTPIRFGPRVTTLPGATIKGLFARNCGVGISLN
jgi:hypothetical protein